MGKYSIGRAILISVIIGTILLSLLGISGVFSLIIMGFIATYLTVDSQRSYKVGGIAGGILGIMLFIYSFFTPPELPYNLSVLDFGMIGLALGGILTLAIGFIVSIVVCYVLGSLGGLVAVKMLKKKTKAKKYKRRNISQRSFKSRKSKKPKRTLRRTYK